MKKLFTNKHSLKIIASLTAIATITTVYTYMSDGKSLEDNFANQMNKAIHANIPEENKQSFMKDFSDVFKVEFSKSNINAKNYGEKIHASNEYDDNSLREEIKEFEEVYVIQKRQKLSNLKNEIISAIKADKQTKNVFKGVQKTKDLQWELYTTIMEMDEMIEHLDSEQAKNSQLTIFRDYISKVYNRTDSYVETLSDLQTLTNDLENINKSASTKVKTNKMTI